MSEPLPRLRRRRTTSHTTVLCVVLVSAALLSLAAAPAKAEMTSLQRGQDLARLLCAECHSIEPTGKSPNADAPPFRDMLSKLTLEGIEDELAEGILLGHKPMPKWDFSERQIYDLSNFISALGD